MSQPGPQQVGLETAASRPTETNCTSDGESFADLLDGDHSWKLRGIGQMSREGEAAYDAGQRSFNWVTVEAEPERDPPSNGPLCTTGASDN
jgi:hypothetical protein